MVFSWVCKILELQSSRQEKLEASNYCSKKQKSKK